MTDTKLNLRKFFNCTLDGIKGSIQATDLRHKSFILLLGCIFFCGSFFPLLAVAFSCFLIFLIPFAEYSEWRREYLIAGFIIVFYSSVCFASRSFFINPADDFSNVYWNQYLGIKNHGFLYIINNDDFAIGMVKYEIGLKFFFKLICLIPIDLKPAGLLFFCILFVSVGFLFFLHEFLSDAKLNILVKKNILVLALLLFSYGLATQLIRQMFSSVLLLFCFHFYENKRIKSIFFLIASILFHQTAIIVFLIYLICFYFPIRTLMIASSTLSLFFYCCILVLKIDIISLIFSSGYDKIDFYTASDFIDSVQEYNYVFLKAAIIFLSLAVINFKTNKSKWANLVFISMLLYFALINIPLAAARINLVFFAVLTGFIIAYFIPERFKLFLTSFTIGIILYQFYRNLNVLERGDDILWTSYKQVSDIPFYFLNEFFS